MSVVRIASLVIGLGLALPALADCPLSEVALTGIVAGKDKLPVPGAVVEATWAEKGSSGVSTRATTDGNGNFNLPIQYNTYSGRTIGGKDKCEFKLDNVSIRVRKEGDGTNERRVDLADNSKPLTIELH